MEGERDGSVAIFHYVDEPVWTTRMLVERIYDHLGKQDSSDRKSSGRMRKLPYIPLSIAKPVAYLSDISAKITNIDFPITADRIEKFCTATKFRADKIRRLGFEQPVSNEQAIGDTVEWHVGMVD